jgi:hypothetical protein
MALREERCLPSGVLGPCDKVAVGLGCGDSSLRRHKTSTEGVQGHLGPEWSFPGVKQKGSWSSLEIQVIGPEFWDCSNSRFDYST